MNEALPCRGGGKSALGSQKLFELIHEKVPGQRIEDRLAELRSRYSGCVKAVRIFRIMLNNVQFTYRIGIKQRKTEEFVRDGESKLYFFYHSYQASEFRFLDTEKLLAYPLASS